MEGHIQKGQHHGRPDSLLWVMRAINIVTEHGCARMAHVHDDLVVPPRPHLQTQPMTPPRRHSTTTTIYQARIKFIRRIDGTVYLQDVQVKLKHTIRGINPTIGRSDPNAIETKP